MDIYKEKVLHTMDTKALTSVVSKYTTVYTSESSNVPPAIWDRLLPILKQAGDDAQKKLEIELRT